MSESFRVLEVQSLWTLNGWLEPGYVTVSSLTNKVTAVSADRPDTVSERLAGVYVPGFFNAHSHAFQYDLGGRVEHLAPGQEEDDFWSWRESMYELALDLDPDKLRDVATRLYRELKAKGYRGVAEFHYVHHQADGTPYDDIAELSGAIIQAAEEAQLDLTLIPIYYNQGGFNQAPQDRQRRFICRDRDQYLKLLESVKGKCDQSERANWGVGVHSLRAATTEDISAIFNEFGSDVPKHIHISEQVAEVEQCQQVLGKRPVEWMLDNLDLNSSYHLVHATHMIESEVKNLAETGAHVVLCPSTEGNLGDGVFPFTDYIKAGGAWSIGSDSHVGTSPTEELRWLDYVQRLVRRKRNTLCEKGGQDSGELLYQQSLLGGLQAMGYEKSQGEWLGRAFDPLEISALSGRLVGQKKEYLLSTLVFTS